MDSSELMASGLDDHNNERHSFPMVPPLKRVAEEASSSSAAASPALSLVKKACSDLTDESAMNDWDAELKQELHDNDAWSVSVVDSAMTDSDTELNQELDCEDIDLFSSFRWYGLEARSNDDSATTDWELEQELLKYADKEVLIAAEIKLKFGSILDGMVDGFYWEEIPYEKLYLAFKVMQRMFLHAHVKLPDGLKNICQKSIYWQGIPEELSLALSERLDMTCTFIREREMFEKWLLESIDFVLEKSVTMHEVGIFVTRCQVEESHSEFESNPLPDIRWFLHWLENTEAPYVQKRAKAHSLMLKLAFRKYITGEEYKKFGIFRRKCVHVPFYDGYDTSKTFEDCRKDCVECRKLFPILQKHFDFMKWLNDGTSKTHEFICSLLDVNVALNLKGSVDVPDEVIDDCYVSFFDLPKALIRDCIYDTLLVKRMEVEVAKELEVFCHIVNHECAKRTSPEGDVSLCKELICEIPDYVYEYAIAFYKLHSEKYGGQELIDHFDAVLCKQTEKYKSCICYYYADYDGLEYDCC